MGEKIRFGHSGASYSKIASMSEHLGRCSVSSAYNTSAGSAEPLTSQPNERMEGSLQGELDLKTSGPESEKWEKPIGKEPGNWEKIPRDWLRGCARASFP